MTEVTVSDDGVERKRSKIGRGGFVAGVGMVGVLSGLVAVFGKAISEDHKRAEKLAEIAAKGVEALQKENELMAKEIEEVWGFRLGETRLDLVGANDVLSQIKEACLLLPPGIGQNMAEVRRNAVRLVGPVTAIGQEDFVDGLVYDITGMKCEAQGNGRF